MLKKEMICIMIVMLLLTSVFFGMAQQNIATESSSGEIDWWRSSRHDPQNTGFSTSPAPDTANLIWNIKIDYDIRGFDHSPTIVDDKLYIADGRGRVFCYDAIFGENIWIYTEDTYGFVPTAPSVADGKVFFGNLNGKLYCLDAVTGELIWTYFTGFISYSNCPTVIDGKVYISTLAIEEESNMFCLDAATGELIWSYDLDGDGGSAAVADGKVYFEVQFEHSFNNYGSRMLCLDANNGEEFWTYTLTSDFIHSLFPAVSEGRIFFGSSDSNVYCLNAETGEEIWNFTTGGYVSSSPAVAYGNVYIGSDDKKLYCLDVETGMEQWNFMTNDSVDLYESPIVADDKVFLLNTADEDKVYCLDAFNGSVIWMYTINQLSSPLAIADGKIYVGGQNKYYCFGLESQPPETPTITGSKMGVTGTEYTYTASSVDPEGDRVYYWFDWGDGNHSGWQKNASASHIWESGDLYSVRVKARDSYNAVSEWGELKVLMPKSKGIQSFFIRFCETYQNLFPFLQRLLKVV